MSKHSKWAKVKNYKGAADAKRAAVFTRLARQITVAARDGGGDISFNFKLRASVDQALEANLPKDNIERAIKKGTGEIVADSIEAIIYEGYGPGGIAILIETLTDSRNRTSATVRHTFSLHGGNMGTSGSVQWMFEHKGVIHLKTKPTEDQELALIDAGADDIAVDGDDVTVICAPALVAKLRDSALASGLAISSLGFDWHPKEPIALNDTETRANLEQLLEALDEDEDVSALYTNLA